MHNEIKFKHIYELCKNEVIGSKVEDTSVLEGEMMAVHTFFNMEMKKSNGENLSYFYLILFFNFHLSSNVLKNIQAQE